MTEDYADHLSVKYFSVLRAEEANTPDYCRTQGNLYEDLLDDANVDEEDALRVTQFLNRGMVDEAEEKVYDLLE